MEETPKIRGPRPVVPKPRGCQASEDPQAWGSSTIRGSCEGIAPKILLNHLLFHPQHPYPRIWDQSWTLALLVQARLRRWFSKLKFEKNRNSYYYILLDLSALNHHFLIDIDGESLISKFEMSLGD